MRDYVSLIVDIENSRRYNIDDRNEMQKFMIQCMEQLNKAFSKSLEFPMTFSAGDEIQGLFRDITPAILFLRIIEMMILPVRLRAGIGIGEWNVKIKNGVSTQQDGPAYHRARQAIGDIHKSQIQRYKINSDYNDDFINNLINVSYILKEQQGYMQNIALLLMELLYPFKKEDLILYDHGIIRDLLNIKYHYRMGEKRFSIAEKYLSKQEIKGDDLGVNLLEVIDAINIDGKDFTPEEKILKRNMGATLAEILGCTRQNVEMLIKRGNSVAIRNMDYVALQYIERKFSIYDI